MISTAQSHFNGFTLIQDLSEIKFTNGTLCGVSNDFIYIKTVISFFMEGNFNCLHWPKHVEIPAN